MHAQGGEANSTQKGFEPGASHCEGRALTTAPPCRPFIAKEKLKSLKVRLCNDVESTLVHQKTAVDVDLQHF